MAIRYLKQAREAAEFAEQDVSDTVAVMLARIKSGGEAVALEYASKLDGWDAPVEVSETDIAKAVRQVPEALRDDIRWAYENIKRFAQAQLATVSEMEVELRPGLFAGQKLIPVSSVGAYVPGGRYAHIASALMTITTAKVAGVQHVTACSPPKAGQGIHPAILFAMQLAGADKILAIGGVQGIAAMAEGLFETPSADILIGPGNAYVAEAKRQMFGPVGIDMFAGPTDSMVVADNTADALTVAWDLVSQAEHGHNSPVWLVTDNEALARNVMALVPGCIAELPELNRAAATAAWRDLGEVIVCDNHVEVAEVANRYGPEHLHVQAADLDWWQGALTSYGSLFLGADTTVSFGDKAAGPNHTLPTSGAARYTGGLSVHKFLKVVTYQRAESEVLPDIARVTANISRHEGMEGHARAADLRLRQPQSKLKLA
ncbi:histidinol dehydrogenase [Lentibacter algarum]|uniref:histidinol dehydrogenase n=1 Tax=Lentibacter algarum TaxID=576131 RepID=UPI001C07E8DF|nr:histidinol dehydrogenase [Lentibacter algarum]MBU2981378.1 histidinol dehydrogenase [Lentibacter algarum]